MVSRVEIPGWANLALSSKSCLYRANQSHEEGRRKEVRADRLHSDSMKLPCPFSACPLFCCSASSMSLL